MHIEKKKRKIDVTIEITDTGYSAYTPNEGIFTTGEKLSELHENLLEAFNLAYEDSGMTIRLEDLRLFIDLQQFFQYYNVLNAKFLAQKIGMNPTLLSQYVRGIKHPSAKQKDKIMKGIQRIGKELSEISLI